MPLSTGTKELYLIFFLSITIPLTWTWNSSDVLTIRKNTVLSSSYDRLVRPSQITNVSVALNLLTINYLDIKHQVLSAAGWLEASWEDHRLTWDISQYPNITYIFADESEVWRPVFFVDNSVSDLSIISDSKLLYRITSTGEVEWEQPRMFTTHCSVVITFYPFDTQICEIKLTSWGYATDEMELHPTHTFIISEDLEPNGEWHLLKTGVRKEKLTEIRVNGSLTRHWVIVFTMVLERRTAYYITGILLPVFLLSYLNTLVFFLPVESGEKIGFILTVLLSLAVLLTIITDKIPSTSIDVSVLSVYLAITLCFSVISCILSVVVMSVHFRDSSKHLPSWAEKLIENNTFPFVCLKKCSCCIKTNRNKTNIANETNARKVDMNVQDFDMAGKDDTDTLKKPNKFTWADLARKLDSVFFYVTFILITLETIVIIVILLIGGTVSSQKLVNSL